MRSFKVCKNYCKIATNFTNNLARNQMEKIIKLTALMFIVIGLSACGKMGELEAVKNNNQTTTQAIDAATTSVAVAPELDIMPHNSK